MISEILDRCILAPFEQVVEALEPLLDEDSRHANEEAIRLAVDRCKEANSAFHQIVVARPDVRHEEQRQVCKEELVRLIVKLRQDLVDQNGQGPASPRNFEPRSNSPYALKYKQTLARLENLSTKIQSRFQLIQQILDPSASLFAETTSQSELLDDQMSALNESFRDEQSDRFKAHQAFIEARLADERDKESSEARHRLNVLTDFASVNSNRYALKWHLPEVYESVTAIYGDFERYKASQLTKKELSSYIYRFLLIVIKKIRALSISKRLVEYIGKCFEFTLNDERVSIKKVARLSNALALCIELLRIKGNND